MNKTLKVVLIIILVLVVMCCCVGTALAVTGVVSMGSLMKNIDANTTENPEEVAVIASDIVDFDLPAGFGNPYGMKILNISSVGYFSQDNKTHILLTELPKNLNLNVEEIMQSLQEKSGKGQVTVNGGQFTSVEDRPVTIRGKQSTLIIKDGVSSEGETVRIGTVTFDSKQGNQAILMISGPVDSWDDNMVNTLIASFK
jgi:hypothetical protein